MVSQLRVLCVCFICCWTTGGYAQEAKQEQSHEIQVLIDVSGSMKQNDPQNLRIPALKLLLNLLPNDTKVGIWLFSENTSELVKTGVVDQQWKKDALSKINKIHSRGLFTDIEGAIQAAAKDWFDSESEHKRHIIILTDGMVDISKDIMLSAESRDRILTEQIPLLQKAGIEVKTIALSENADSELLEKLAFDTLGWSETAWTADQLQKVFFTIFKQSVPQDTVPLKGNVFNIDASIKEFSVLIFKQTGAPKTAIIAPDKERISQIAHKSNVFWLDEKNYDLITIKEPVAGKWKIDAEMDPDNQVMIVTDLKFHLEQIPNQVVEKESFELSAFFTDKQQLISREDFLSLINISIEQTDEFGSKKRWKMRAVKENAGLFSKTIGASFKKGKHRFKVTADSKTFQREIFHTLVVMDNLVSVEQRVDLSERVVHLKLIADETILNTDMMTVQAVITYTNQETTRQELEKIGNYWQLDINAPSEDERVLINFSAMAKTIQGEPVSPDIKPVVIDASLFSTEERVAETEVNEPMKEIIEIKDKLAINEETIEEEEALVDEKKAVSWGKSWAIVIGVNIVFMVAGFFLFKAMKKRAVNKQAELLGRLA